MANIDQDYEWKLIVGGEEISTSTHYDIIDPNTTGIVGKAPEATVQQTLQAAAAAKEALPKWKALSMDERCTYIAKAADALEVASAEWVDLVQAETGATMRIAKTMQVAVAFPFILKLQKEEDKDFLIAKNDSNKPIILVIPIQTLGDAQEGLDRAITESLISNISRYNGVKTLSSGISYEVQRRQFNREDFKNQLGVTHLVKGSLQSVGKNNRLSLELTKVNEETIIWSKQLEFELNQLFDIQDVASLELLNSIQINAVTGDVAAQSEKDFTTFEQFKLALNRRGEWRKWTSDGHAKSVEITSQLEGLGVDQYVILNLKAWNLHQKLLLRLSQNPEEDKKILLGITEKLIAERGRANDFGIRSIVEMEHFGKDCSLAETYAEKVIEMEPGGDSFTGAGFVYMRCGKLEKAAETWKAGLLAQPIDQGYQITRMYAPLLFRLERYSETEEILKDIIDDPAIGMNQPWIYASLLVDKGENERAKFYFDLGVSRGANEQRISRALRDRKAIEKLLTNLMQFRNLDQ